MVSSLAVAMFVPREAQAQRWQVGGTMQVDFSAGSDELLTLDFIDGTSENIKAGDGVTLALSGGLRFRAEEAHQLELLLNLGIRYTDTQPAINGGVDFLRLPIEALAFYRLAFGPSGSNTMFLRTGVGLAVHLMNELTGEGVLSGLHLRFGPALGWILQADLGSTLVAPHQLIVGLRYTRIGYRADGMSRPLSANAVGLQLGYLVEL
ncbi:MAG: hypothetical protein MJD61_02160 [Proteobacteria bacterium]|nr:hypothetical protein [Pseudomonadota bacterium]